MLLYDQDDVQFYHGDCGAVLPQLPPVDLIVTSPPYGGLRSFGGHGWDFYSVAPAIADSLVDGGVMCWQTDDEVVDGSYSGESFRTALWFMDEAGLRLHDRIIVDREFLVGGVVNRWLAGWNFVWVFSRGKPKTFNPIIDRPNSHAGKIPGGTPAIRDKEGNVSSGGWRNRYTVPDKGKRQGIWRIPGGFGMEMLPTGDIHPSRMPLRLAYDLVKAYSNAGDLVLDPFSGSGTTAQAAMLQRRRAIGIEIHEPYIHAGIAARFSQRPLITLE